MDKFLDQVCLPKASADMLETLNAEVTEAKIGLTISTLGLGKAPGPVGFTSEFYKLTRDQIAPTLAQYFYGIPGKFDRNPKMRTLRSCLNRGET